MPTEHAPAPAPVTASGIRFWMEPWSELHPQDQMVFAQAGYTESKWEAERKWQKRQATATATDATATDANAPTG